MTELGLAEIRKIQVDVLENLDSFCKKSGIEYLLCNGTLLGAVKYSGYIPWDDDIDVCLLRSDYERLVKEYNDPNGRFALYSMERNEKYFFPFAKLSDERTTLIEANTKEGLFGVNIDIFPIDCFGDTIEQVEQRFKKMQRLRRRLNFAKLRVYTSHNFAKRIVKFLASVWYRIPGAKWYCKRMTMVARKSEGRYYGDVVWGFYGKGEAFEKALFTETVEVKFEGGLYPAPARYDEYLTGLYGNWRADPPAEKQKSHHRFKAYSKQER